MNEMAELRRHIVEAHGWSESSANLFANERVKEAHESDHSDPTQMNLDHTHEDEKVVPNLVVWPPLDHVRSYHPHLWMRLEGALRPQELKLIHRFVHDQGLSVEVPHTHVWKNEEKDSESEDEKSELHVTWYGRKLTLDQARVASQISRQAIDDVSYRLSWLIRFCHANGFFDHNEFTFPDGETWEGADD